MLISSYIAVLVVNLSLFASAKSYQSLILSLYGDDNETEENNLTLEIYGKKESPSIVHNSLATLIKGKNRRNITPITDKDETTLLLPNMRGSHNIVPKKRNIKKAPKRTIQKIYKKLKKSRKILSQRTSVQTEPTIVETKEETTTTTQATHKKKVKKWNSRYVRYPVPFQRLSKKDVHHRMKREIEPGRDVYILEDLDEIEFLSDEDGTNAIKAHVKKYW